MFLRSTFQGFISQRLDKFLKAGCLLRLHRLGKGSFQPVLDLIAENHKKKPNSTQIFLESMVVRAPARQLLPHLYVNTFQLS